MTKRIPEELKQKVGRHSDIGRIDFAVVEQYAGLGFTEEEIALVLGINVKTIRQYKKKYPQFNEIITRGKLKADSVILNALYKKAKEGDVTAQIFWMKNRQPNRWRDKQFGDKDNPLEINFHLKLVDMINKLDKDDKPKLEAQNEK